MPLLVAEVFKCDRCGRCSDPLSPKDAKRWGEDHAKWHEKADRVKRMAKEGHEITSIVHWLASDESEAWIECSCGFVSEHLNSAWLNDLTDKHLDSVESEEGEK